MPEPILPRDEFWEGSDPAWTLAQIPARDGFALTQVDVVSINLYVYDIQLKTQIYTVAISKLTSIFNTLQLDPYWTEDTIGFNFSHYLSNSAVFAVTPEQDGKMYRLEYEILTNDGSGTIVVAREILCRARFHV